MMIPKRLHELAGELGGTDARQFLLAQPGLIELRAVGRTIRYATRMVRDAYAAASAEPVVEAPYRPQAIATGDDKQARAGARSAPAGRADAR